MKTPSDHNPIRDNRFFKYASSKRYLRIFVPEFAFKHDNSFEGKDKFVGREVQLRRLFMWLTSTSRSGSYLITGYRGMGKSLLVSRVLDNIARKQKPWPEFVFEAAVIFLFVACFLRFSLPKEIRSPQIITLFSILSGLCVVALMLFKLWPSIKKKLRNWYWKVKYNQDPEELKKTLFRNEDYVDKRYWRIPIYINLGQEVLHERDVLGLIAQNVRNQYKRFVKSKQVRPLIKYLPEIIYCSGACLLARVLTPPVAKVLHSLTQNKLLEGAYDVLVANHKVLFGDLLMLVLAIGLYYLLRECFRWIRKHIPYFSIPYRAIDRLNLLCERINATVIEKNGVKIPDNNTLRISFFKEHKKTFPIANIREIEQELQDIINKINSPLECFRYFRPQFIIVFDELDKIAGPEFKTVADQSGDGEAKSPEFDTSVEGFTGTMEYEERKKNILHLLSNMKMFISTVQAKCVFISGHELFDASLADLSDREFAISSVFNGVLNVDSFLSPEREQNDVSSMTELYLSTILLPESFLSEKQKVNMISNKVAKRELPSLRWYYEYLTTTMLESNKGADEETLKEKEQEIQFAVLFLRYFAVFLAHLCNGSPKKISSTLESYIRTESDTSQLYDWGDIVTVGKRTEKNPDDQCVLWIDPTEQQYINFIHYIASPVMNSITNEVSHYGDKLLVASSFILDQIYKYHSKGFSWRNLEQMPELLNANKNPELRDSMASIMEFQLQTHITHVSSGIHQYKFHKQIAEEITYISMISEEASAIFNFTLNESSTVKRYNMRLFSYYQQLSKQHPKDKRYQTVIGMIHENLGDIYSMDEDYYYAIMEYNNALSSIQSQKLTTENIISYLKCSLKLGNAYEYRRTYENAYMIYSQIIDRLIHFREIDERKLGLEYTYVWTNDWRQKQPMLVDYSAIRKQPGRQKQNDGHQANDSIGNKSTADEPLTMEDRYNKYMNRYAWNKDKPEDIESTNYNQEVGNLIVGLSSDITPVKNEMIQTLEIFEDIDYVYQAIIAKLFLVEKMELGGISYSTLEVAEREFKYLHCTTNLERKYIISADFFQKVASVLYYKNGYVTPPNSGKGLVDALYLFDCNMLDFVEDYCSFCANNKKKDQKGSFNSIETKNALENFFKNAPLDLITDVARMSSDKYPIRISEMWTETVVDYFEFIKKAYPKMFSTIKSKSQGIESCAERRRVMMRMGYKLPCNACKYTHRSLDIQIEHFFVDDIVEKHKGELQIVSFLRLTSRKHIQHLRPSETSLLAHTMEQTGDILLSCSLTRTEEFVMQSKKVHADFDSYDWAARRDWQDYLSTEVVELLNLISESFKSEAEKEEIINRLGKVSFTKIDRVLLYYWCASRFYEMGSLFKEAAYCVERMLKVIQEYLQVLNSSESTEDVMLDSVDSLCGFKHFHGSLKANRQESFTLIHNLFRWAVRFVGRKFNNYGLGEIIENKWLYNLERMDEVDMMLLSEYSDLKSAFLAAVDIKLNCLYFEKRFNSSVLKRNVYQNWYREYLANVYERVSSPLIHDKTFKEEIWGYYMKAVLNKHILIDCLGRDVLSESRLSKQANKDGKADFYADYYEALSDFISKDGIPTRFDNLFFSASNAQERLQLMEYLIQDSIVCLSSILSVLTPHNHYTSFSNSFMGDVYALLWEWAIYYEATYELYLYRRYDEQDESLTKKAIAELVAQNSTFNHAAIEKIMRKCLENVSNVSENKTQGGYQYTRLFMNIRHDIDDATIHHIFTSYAAESAIKYYNLAKDINNEGVEYKNMILGMYVLDDDLRNDTCQSNLADERFMLHCGLIERRRDLLLKIYGQSKIARMGSYESGPVDFEHDTRRRINDRHKDSIYINSEY